MTGRKKQVQNVNIYQGSPMVLTIKVTTNGLPDGPAEDISGASDAQWALFDQPGDAVGSALLIKTLGAAEIVLPNLGTDGVMQVTITAANTAGLATGIKHHEAFLNFGSGLEPVLIGEAHVEQLGSV